MSLVGNLQDLALTDIFQIVGLSGKSGILRLEHTHQGKARVVFMEGKICAAWGPSGLQALEKLLDEESLVVPHALSRLQKDRVDPLMELPQLFAPPAISPDRRTEFFSHLVKQILFDLLQWNSGSFQFELRGEKDGDSTVPKEWILVTDGISPSQIGLEGAKIVDEECRDIDIPAEPDLENSFSEPSAPNPIEEPLFDLAEELRDQFEGTRNHAASSLSPGLSLLKSMLLELHVPNVHTYITLLVLRYAAALMNRAILFQVTEDEYKAIGEFGLAKNKEVSAQLVRKIHIPRNEDSVLSIVEDSKMSVKTKLNMKNTWDQYLSEQLGGHPPAEAFVGPILCEQKLVAVLYGDNIPEMDAIGSTDALEIFLSQAGLAMEQKLTTNLENA